jgi:diphthamide biosynthesis enzyme Dph1/Dph2-like protein
LSDPVRPIVHPIHLERTLLTILIDGRTARLPVIYVLTKRPIDIEHAASSLASTSKDSMDDKKAIILMYDVAYAHKARKLTHQILSLIEISNLLNWMFFIQTTFMPLYNRALHFQ